MNFLGIDIGTSRCKAVVFDEYGKQRAIAHRSYEVQFTENGGVQLNSDEVIQKCFQVINECASEVRSDSICSLAISSQGEAFTAIGENGEILSHAMVSSDARAADLVDQWMQKDQIDELYQITGHTARPIFTLFKMLWLKEFRPDVWDKTQYFLCFEDLLIFKLGLPPTISWSLAGRTMLFDILKGNWNESILNKIGLHRFQLANPVPPGSIVGKIGPRMSEKLGVSKDTLVVTGGHDQGCSALGAGVITEELAMLGSGTVECITAVKRKPAFSNDLRDLNFCTYHYTVPEFYSTIAYSLTGGNLLKWFKEELGTAEKRQSEITGNDVYTVLLKNIEPEPTKLLALPYFTPSGTPYFDYKTKGALIGLRLATNRGEILQAFMEGVAFEMRLNLELLNSFGYHITQLRNVGGGAQTAELIQLKSDIMGIQIDTLNVSEAGAQGAAMLACSATTGVKIDYLIKKWIKVKRSYQPRKTNITKYNERFIAYQEIYRIMKNLNF